MPTNVRTRQTSTSGSRATLLADLPITERRVVAAGMSTAVLEAGSGTDLVLLHGPGEFAAGWFTIIPALARTHHVVAPDLPGHGETAGADDFGQERVVAWLDDVIATTCAAPPVVVGRGLGGAIAMRYAIAHGDRLSRLVLVDSFGLSEFAPAPPFGEALHRYLADPTADTHERLMQYCAHDLDGMRRHLGERFTAYAEYAVDRLQTAAVRAATGSMMEEFAMTEIPEAELARIAVPVALIWGRYDMATPLRVAEAAGRAFGWPLHVVDDAADDPALEQPEAFVDALSEVLR